MIGDELTVKAFDDADRSLRFISQSTNIYGQGIEVIDCSFIS